MAEHTPGPWSFEQPWSGFSAIRGAEGELVFGIAAGSSDERQSDEVCEANARLIAAAPDLLAAAQTVLAGLNARIDAAKLVVPVYDGIADLAAAIASALGADASTEGGVDEAR